MPECTDGERMWLDALRLANGESRSAAIASARARMLMEKLTPGVYASLVELRRAVRVATAADNDAWKKLGLDPDESERLWDRVNEEAAK